MMSLVTCNHSEDDILFPTAYVVLILCIHPMALQYMIICHINRPVTTMAQNTITEFNTILSFPCAPYRKLSLSEVYTLLKIESELRGGPEGKLSPFISNVGCGSEVSQSDLAERPGAAPCPSGGATSDCRGFMWIFTGLYTDGPAEEDVGSLETREFIGSEE